MKPVFLLFAIVALLLPLGSCGGGEPEYLIGVSQCSDDDWRTQLNNEIKREAQFYNGVSVEIRAANDDNARQMRDIEELVHMGADLLIVSPNVVDDVSPAIERAYRAGIPVILVDRRTRSEECTAYVGADNYDIGRRAGEYVVNRLDGNGMVVEITGLSASTPAIDRHQGFMDAIKDNVARRCLTRYLAFCLTSTSCLRTTTVWRPVPTARHSGTDASMKCCS